MSAKLEVNSIVYEGWKAFTISKSIETLCSEFTLSVTDNWSDQNTSSPIKKGDSIKLYLDSDLLITGIVDAVKKSISASDFTISISGRDRTKDLVDCSADVGAQFNNLKLEKLCEKLFTPFGISVIAKVDTGMAIPTVSVSQGDSPFEIVEKRARQKGLLLISNVDGNVEITTPASVSAFNALVLGENLLSCATSSEENNQFSEYKVKGQNNLDEEGVGGFAVMGKSTDLNVTRYRPLIIPAENITDNSQAKKRAEFEAITRAAKAGRVSCVVDGFRQSNGQLWSVNQLTRVHAPLLDLINETLLITSINYSLSDEGELTTFELMRPDAFIPTPEVPENSDVALGGLEE